VADDVLRQAVQGISDLITVPGLINLDFCRRQAIMSGMGMALMGAGRATERIAPLMLPTSRFLAFARRGDYSGSARSADQYYWCPDLTLYEVHASGDHHS